MRYIIGILLIVCMVGCDGKTDMEAKIALKCFDAGYKTGKYGHNYFKVRQEVEDILYNKQEEAK